MRDTGMDNTGVARWDERCQKERRAAETWNARWQEKCESANRERLLLALSTPPYASVRSNAPRPRQSDGRSPPQQYTANMASTERLPRPSSTPSLPTLMIPSNAAMRLNAGWTLQVNRSHSDARLVRRALAVSRTALRLQQRGLPTLRKSLPPHYGRRRVGRRCCRTNRHALRYTAHSTAPDLLAVCAQPPRDECSRH